MDKKIQWYFFGLIGLVVITLSFFIIRPFMSSLAVAIFLAILFYPLQQRLLRWFPRKKRFAAIVVVSAVFLGIVIPLSFLSVQLVRESQSIYAEFKSSPINDAGRFLQSAESEIQKIIPDFSFNFSEYASSAILWASERIGALLYGTAEGLFLTLLIIFLFYYFLSNGEALKKQAIELSPLPDDNDEKIMESIKQTVDSVLKGTLLIALIQGFLAGIGLWIFGVPNPVIWGSIAAASAFIPGIGTGLVLIPAVLYLVLIDRIGAGIGLGIWGAVIVGLADNILVPLFYGKNIKVHPVFVLLFVLGGLGFFGILGFILGPIILCLLVALLDIYRFSAKKLSLEQR